MACGFAWCPSPYIQTSDRQEGRRSRGIAKKLDEQNVGEGGTQGAIGVVTVEREGALVVEEVLVAFVLLAASAILAPIRCNDVMIIQCSDTKILFYSEYGSNY